MEYDILDYKEKIINYLKSEWDFGNSILYNMCKDYPLHKEVGIVIGKVWLIGRSYAAAIERMKGGGKDIDGFYINKIAPKIIESDIDEKLSLFDQNEAMAENNIPAILELHKYLCDKLKEITGKTNRSFCSKYLHFHRPNLFYIYDSIASKGLNKIRINIDELFKKKIFDSKPTDEEYADFFIKCFYLTFEIREKLGIGVSPRQLDNLLLDIKKSKP